MQIRNTSAGDREGQPREELEALGLAMVTAFNERDLNAMLALTHREVMHRPSRAVSAGPYHGHAGVRAWWSEMIERGVVYEITTDEITVLQAGPRAARRDDWQTPSELSYVAVFGHYCIDGEPLGPWAGIYTVQAGLVLECHGYLSTRPMLEELGIIRTAAEDDLTPLS